MLGHRRPESPTVHAIISRHLPGPRYINSNCTLATISSCLAVNDTYTQFDVLNVRITPIYWNKTSLPSSRTFTPSRAQARPSQRPSRPSASLGKPLDSRPSHDGDTHNVSAQYQPARACPELGGATPARLDQPFRSDCRQYDERGSGDATGSYRIRPRPRVRPGTRHDTCGPARPARVRRGIIRSAETWLRERSRRRTQL